MGGKTCNNFVIFFVITPELNKIFYLFKKNNKKEAETQEDICLKFT